MITNCAKIDRVCRFEAGFQEVSVVKQLKVSQYYCGNQLFNFFQIKTKKKNKKKKKKKKQKKKKQQNNKQKKNKKKKKRFSSDAERIVESFNM